MALEQILHVFHVDALSRRTLRTRSAPAPRVFMSQNVPLYQRRADGDGAPCAIHRMVAITAAPTTSTQRGGQVSGCLSCVTDLVDAAPTDGDYQVADKERHHDITLTLARPIGVSKPFFSPPRRSPLGRYCSC